MLAVEALSRMEGVGGNNSLMVEAFVASHSGRIMNTAASNVSLQSTSWLRVRKVVMPSLVKDLEDVCYDAVIIHDWSTAAYQPWLTRGPGEDAVHNALSHLSSFIAPGAPVVVLGVNGEDAEKPWVEHLSRLGTARSYPEKSLVIARTSSSYTSSAPQEGNNLVVLVVADDADGVGQSLSDHFTMNGSHHVADVQVLTCGKGPGFVFDDEEGVHWGGALGSALQAIQDRGQRLSGIVFAAGMNDPTVLGLKAFDRLTRLSQALLPNGQLLSSIKPADRNILFWVLTLCSYDGEMIRPNQGVIEGLGKVLVTELGDVGTRLVDMDSLEDISQVAALVHSPPREHHYRVGKMGISVCRAFAVNVDGVRSMIVSPESETSYYCDVSPELSTPGAVSWRKIWCMQSASKTLYFLYPQVIHLNSMFSFPTIYPPLR